MSEVKTPVRALGRLKARELSMEEANVVSGGGISYSITGEIKFGEKGEIDGTDGGPD
jgi:uncharacterized protein YgiM (DUF1202 family)